MPRGVPAAEKKFLWTTQAIRQLRKLAAQGKTSHEIADITGLSRGAVIGKMQREGIQLLGKPLFGVSPGSGKPRDPHEPLPLEQRIGAGPAILSLTHRQCGWPIGDPTDQDFHFCSARRDPNISPPYCPKHLDVGVNKLASRLTRLRA